MGDIEGLATVDWVDDVCEAWDFMGTRIFARYICSCLMKVLTGE